MGNAVLRALVLSIVIGGALFSAVTYGLNAACPLGCEVLMPASELAKQTVDLGPIRELGELAAIIFATSMFGLFLMAKERLMIVIGTVDGALVPFALFLSDMTPVLIA